MINAVVETLITFSLLIIELLKSTAVEGRAFGVPRSPRRKTLDTLQIFKKRKEELLRKTTNTTEEEE